VRGDLRPRGDRSAIEANARSARRPVGRDLAGVRAEARGGVLRRDPALERCPAELEVLLLQRELPERHPERDAHLGLHEVHVRDFLRHGVLDLDPGVHLDEDVLTRALPRGVEQELDGSRVHVADRLREGDRVAVHRLPDRLVEVGCGSDLDDLLVAPLHGAVALEEVDGLPRRVRQDLDLDVARAHDGLLEEHRRVAEGAVGLAHRLFERGAQLLLGVDAAHPSAAAAGDRLGEDGEADLLGPAEQLLDVPRGGCGLQNRNARRDGVFLGRDLVARHLEHLRRRTDERDARVGGCLGKVRVLGEEAVARVDRVRSGLVRYPDDLRDIQVGADGMPDLADLVGLIGLEPVHGVPVLVREDGDRLGSQLECGAKCTNSNLATIGHEDLLEHPVPSLDLPSLGRENSGNWP
jgi:hypothetical protein